MQESNQPSYTDTVADHLVRQIITKTEKEIRKNQFVKKNQNPWVVHSHQNIINNTLNHIRGGPDKSPSKVDQQPNNIPQDTLMNTGLAQQGLTPTVFEPKKSSLGNTSYQKSARKSKASNFSIASLSNVQNQVQNTKNNLKELPKHPLDQVQEEQYVNRIRQFKIQQELKQKQIIVEEKPKVIYKLQKGENVVFDFQGKYSKRKETNAKQFQYSHLQSGSSPQQRQSKKRSVSHCLPQNKGDSVVISSKVVIKKSKQTQEEDLNEEKQVIFNQNNKKEDMLKSIQINNPGIKITVDGAVVKRDRAATEAQNSRVTHKVKTVQLRKDNFDRNHRIKTENLIENSSKTNRDVSSTKRPSKQHKRRIGTEVSMYSGSKTEKISVENHNLHKMILESEEALESKYIEIPYKKSNQKRFKTNVEIQSIRQYSQADSIRLRDKLSSSNKVHESLPRIKSHYKQAESQIMKILKKKHVIV